MDLVERNCELMRENKKLIEEAKELKYIINCLRKNTMNNVDPLPVRLRKMNSIK